MRYLFLHPVFPGQFGKVMEALARDPANEVVHCSRVSAVASIAGVRKMRYKLPEPAPHPTLAFAQKMENTIQHAQIVLKAVQKLKRDGFVPDLIYGYAGWGPTLFMKDLYPKVPLLGYFEWFLNPHGAEFNFDPANPLALDAQLALRLCNVNMLLDLQACDHGVTPTCWQQSQFPAEYRRDKISVVHDGVDTDFYQPATEVADVQLPGIDLTGVREVITYATRGMEPFRGFPQFMRALALVQKRRPHCHALIVGSEEYFYSKPPPGAKSYKELLLRELEAELDLSRVHFTGWLDHDRYRTVLQASRAHVYLTYPYVLSWSLLEAMSCGCLVIGSRTAPVEEVIRHDDNGRLTDFFDHAALADQIEAALEDDSHNEQLRRNARQTVLDRYDLKKVLPRHLALINYQAVR